MSKRKAQIDIGNEDEQEECLPQIGKINTPDEIAQRKILKIKGPKQINESKNINLFIKASKPFFTPSPQPIQIEQKKIQEQLELIQKGLANQQSAKLFESSPPENQEAKTLIVFSEDVKPMNLVRTSSMKSEKMFEHASHSLPDTLFPTQNPKKSHGIISPTIVFPEKPPLAPSKKVKTQLESIKETEEYKLFDTNVQKIKLNEKEHSNSDINMQIFKNQANDTHYIQINIKKEPLYKGIIINNKYTKQENNTISLETQNMEEKGNPDILEIVFSLIVDFENFHI